MSKGKVTILGINGHVGQAAATAFVAAGWQVAGMGRSDKHRLAGVRFVVGDSDSVEDMRRAIGDADIVVNALNMPYHTWDRGRMEAQMSRVVAAMGQTGKTMLFPGNIYNYAADLKVISPETDQDPETPRGEIRKRVEAGFRAAVQRGGIQIIVLRAGDFFGPGTTGDWFDEGIFRELGKGKVSLLGRKGVGHTWAYLPDLGRAFEALASVRSNLPAFENFHFAGHFVTPEQMQTGIAAALPAGYWFAMFPWSLLYVMGLFNPVMGAIAKMGYLWTHPMQLRDRKLEALLGSDFGTRFEDAMAATTASHLARLGSESGATSKSVLA